MIRVGLIVSLRGEWLGGANYFKNLLTCYRKFPDPEVRLEVFSPHPKDLLEYECEAITIHPWPELQRDRLSHFPRRALRKLLAYDPVLVRTLRRHRLDLLAYSTLGAESNVKTLQWQPDFQHKRLPEFFSEKECAQRDAAIAESKRWGNLLLSSHSAAADFRHYYPSWRPCELMFCSSRRPQFSTLFPRAGRNSKLSIQCTNLISICLISFGSTRITLWLFGR